jgi:hypothetical protein
MWTNFQITKWPNCQIKAGCRGGDRWPGAARGDCARAGMSRGLGGFARGSRSRGGERGREDGVWVDVRWLAGPGRRAAPPATVVRPAGRKAGRAAVDCWAAEKGTQPFAQTGEGIVARGGFARGSRSRGGRRRKDDGDGLVSGGWRAGHRCATGNGRAPCRAEGGNRHVVFCPMSTSPTLLRSPGTLPRAALKRQEGGRRLFAGRVRKAHNPLSQSRQRDCGTGRDCAGGSVEGRRGFCLMSTGRMLPRSPGTIPRAALMAVLRAQLESAGFDGPLK